MRVTCGRAQPHLERVRLTLGREHAAHVEVVLEEERARRAELLAVEPDFGHRVDTVELEVGRGLYSCGVKGGAE